MSLLPQLLIFAITLICLLILSRWINQQVQTLGLYLTGNYQVAVMGYYLVMFPGILLHELSHIVMARVLGLKVGKLALGPRKRRHAIELGSVTVNSGGAVRDSLVGLAPFITGTAVLLLVSYQVFDVTELGRAWVAGGWRNALQGVNGLWTVPDFWVWAYVIFVVSNAMTPSPADRQPWLVAGIYIGVALLLAYLVGGLPMLSRTLGEQVAGILQMLTLGFLFTVAVDAAAAVVLWATTVALVRVRRS